MSNYLYFRQTDLPFPERFTFDSREEGYRVLGVDSWRNRITLLMEYLAATPERQAGIREEIQSRLLGNNTDSDSRLAMVDRPTEELILLLLQLTLQSIPRDAPRDRCPRLFISHRHADALYALRIAKLALDHRFAFWLDILDPSLLALGTTPPANPALLPLLTACIIEMALLNCTHVIACMTPNSPGSAWIPYEFGRIKDQRLITINTASWLHPAFPSPLFPDYLLLGEITQNEPQINRWLAAEYLRWGSSGCIPRSEPAVDNIPPLP